MGKKQIPYEKIEEHISFIYSVASIAGEIPNGMTAEQAKAKMRKASPSRLKQALAHARKCQKHHAGKTSAATLH